MIYQLNSEYYVRPLREKDLLGPYLSWFEDQEVCRYNSHGKFFKSQSDFRNYIDKQGSEEHVVWAICHATDGHIGNVSLQRISFIHRHAEFAMLVGDKRHWGKGVGTMAAQALFLHGFNKLNLERIWCATASTNVALSNLVNKLGMVKEGCRRSHLYMDGQWVDMIEFGLLRRECSFLDTNF